MPPRREELDRILAEAVHIRVPPNFRSQRYSAAASISRSSCITRGSSAPRCLAILPSAATRPIIMYAQRYAEETGLDLREVAIEAHCAKTLPLIATVVEAVETSSRRRFGRASIPICCRSAFIRMASASHYAAKAPTNYSRATRRSNTAFMQPNGAGRNMQRQCLGMMHRANLQRVDRCSMQFQLEIREPFLDQTVVGYAVSLINRPW